MTMARRTTLFHSAVLICFFATGIRNFAAVGDYHNDASIYAPARWNSPADRDDYSVETLRDSVDSATQKPQKDRTPKKHVLSQTIYETEVNISMQVDRILDKLTEQGLQLEAIQYQLQQQQVDTPASSPQSTPNWPTVWLPYLTLYPQTVAPGLPNSSPNDYETWKLYESAMQRQRRRGRGGTSEFQQVRGSVSDTDKPPLDGVTSWISHLINNVVPGHNADDPEDPANPGSAVPQGTRQRKNENRRRKVKKIGGP